MSSLFRNKDITSSDFKAGLILLRNKQNRESEEQIRPTTSSKSIFKHINNYHKNIFIIILGVSECFSKKPDWMSLEKARHYLQLSIASYGWRYLIYRYGITGLFKIIPKCFCCACFR